MEHGAPFWNVTIRTLTISVYGVVCISSTTYSDTEFLLEWTCAREDLKGGPIRHISSSHEPRDVLEYKSTFPTSQMRCGPLKPMFVTGSDLGGFIICIGNVMFDLSHGDAVSITFTESGFPYEYEEGESRTIEGRILEVNASGVAFIAGDGATVLPGGRDPEYVDLKGRFTVYPWHVIASVYLLAHRHEYESAWKRAELYVRAYADVFETDRFSWEEAYRWGAYTISAEKRERILAGGAS